MTEHITPDQHDCSEAALYDEAARRYIHDAEFHALVDAAVLVTERERGGFTEPQRGVAISTAAVALVIHEQNSGREAGS